MIRISALNDKDPDNQLSDVCIRPKEASNEILLEEATRRYTKALEDQRNQYYIAALEAYKRLLETPLLQNVRHMTEEEQEMPQSGVPPIYSRPALLLKYSCLKNIGDIYKMLCLFDMATEYYNQATNIDSTDVMLWLNYGQAAIDNGNIQLAAYAYIIGMAVKRENKKVMECSALCHLYMGANRTVLEIISVGFMTYPNWITGFALRNLVFDMAPYLNSKQALHERNPLIEVFMDRQFTNEELNFLHSEKTRLTNKLNAMRNISFKTHSLIRDDQILWYPLIRPLQRLSWVELATSLIHMHDYIENVSTSSRLKYGTCITLDHIKQELVLTRNEKNEEKAEEPETCDKFENSEETNTCTEKDHKGKNKRKPGSALMEELLWSGKRRSARVRTTRKESDSMSIADALRNILPRTLLHTVKPLSSDVTNVDDKSMDTMDLFRLFEEQEIAKGTKELEKFQKEMDQDRDREMEETGYFHTLQEEADIKEFLEKETNQPIGHIIRNLILRLQKMWHISWPKVLIDLYLKGYKIMQKSFPPKSYRPNFEFTEEIKLEVGACLLFFELTLDATENCCLNENLPLIMFNQVTQVMYSALTDYPEKSILCLRALWMRAEYFFRENCTSLGIEDLEYAVHLFEMYPELEKKVILLKNCNKRRIISEDIVQQAIKAQSRKSSLVEVTRLYEEKNYEQLADLLSETLNSGIDVKKLFDDDIVDRQTMINMLINSYFFLEKYNNCIYWEEITAHELLKTPNATDVDCQKWIVDLDRILVGIEECCERGNLEIVNALPSSRLSRFTQTLCHAICKQSELSERPPCASRPWAILYKILVSLENKEPVKDKDKESDDNEEDEDDEDDDPIPPSVLLLFTAHEYLGRREWCNCDGNVLLFLILDQITPKIRLPDWFSFRETVQQHLEQVVFCLYGHPSKKSRARYLTDHNVSPISLTWERAMQLFELFRPDVVPSYDSLRINLISSETEILFRRIAALIPDESDPAPHSRKMLDFIYGKIDKIPNIEIKLPLPVQDLFYVLGDYYIKTHESAKAMNYLIIDLCSNPHRVDAWASMALSRGSLLECNLNSGDPIKSDEFLEDAMAAVRCYQHCLKLDPSQCTLWIEFGSFTYAIQSFCSQRIKLDSDCLNLEQFEEMQTKMLECAKIAFSNANIIWSKDDAEDADRQDERWLHYYMLGKISEKLKDLQYLEHYEKAAQLLYDNNAQYPKKISYNAPQTLSIESLEIFYRVHACIIKNLELCDGEPLDDTTRKNFSRILTTFSNGPFIQQLSKSDKEKQKQSIKDLEYEKEITELKFCIKKWFDGIILKIVSSREKIQETCEELLHPESDSELLRYTDVFNKEIIEPYKSMNRTESEQQKSNYYLTLDDIQNMSSRNKLKKTKKRKARSIASSGTSTSENIKYDDASSSSSDSSDSSSSESSSSSSLSNIEEEEGNNEENKHDEAPKEFDTEEAMLQQCIKALELCCQRFPQHYKSVYRLAHFYYRSKKHKDLNKCKELLLGHYKSNFGVIGGLFQERKVTNYFNGIWRLPCGDVDRPGNFASHMSRSVLLLLEVLRDLKDHKQLMELSTQLKKTPEPDKKYLREDERKQLAKQSLTLCLQTLKTLSRQSPITVEVLIDAFLTYQKVHKHYPGKEAAFADLLVEFYKKFKNVDDDTPCPLLSFDQIIKFCQSERTKLGPVHAVTPVQKKIRSIDKQTPKSIKKAKMVLAQRASAQRIIEDSPLQTFPPLHSVPIPHSSQLPNLFPNYSGLTSDFFTQYQKYLSLMMQSQQPLVKRPRGRPPKNPRYNLLAQNPIIPSAFPSLRQPNHFPAFSPTSASKHIAPLVNTNQQRANLMPATPKPRLPSIPPTPSVIKPTTSSKPQNVIPNKIPNIPKPDLPISCSQNTSTMKPPAKGDETPPLQKTRFNIDDILGCDKKLAMPIFDVEEEDQVEAINLSPDWKHQAYETARKSIQDESEKIQEVPPTFKRKLDIDFPLESSKRKHYAEPEVVTIDDDD